MKSLLCVLAIFCLNVSAEKTTLYVDGPYLYSAAGERIIIRGFNEMFVWSNDKIGNTLLPEIAKSGANSIRLVWDYNFPAAQLSRLIENSIAHKMLAIPECHNATGKWGEELQACINFWKQDELISTIQANKQWTILNIANEAGGHDISDDDFIKTYKQAISQLRAWGYTVPIMIDATRWGQNLKQLVRTAPEILAHDPLKNIIFSAHSYWAEDIAIGNYQLMAESAHKQGIVYIIGEGPSVTRVGQCENPKPLPYLKGMQILQEHNIGWLNWSWGGMKNGDCDDFLYFDLTKAGRFGEWTHEPGANIVALDPNSVMQTSERPASFYENSIDASALYLHVAETNLIVGASSDYQVFIAPVNTQKSKDLNIEVTIVKGQSRVSLDTKNRKIHALSSGSVHLRARLANSDLVWDTWLTIQ